MSINTPVAITPNPFYFDREPGLLYNPPRKPSVIFSDAHGTVKIEFLADIVTMGLQGEFNVSNLFVNNVIADGATDNETTTSIVKSNIANNVMTLIQRGDITCASGNTNFIVSVDTNTSTSASTIGLGDGLIVQNMVFARQLTPEQMAEHKRLQKIANFKAAIQQKMAPAILNHLGDRPRSLAGGANFSDASRNEIVALHLLRSMVDADVFKKYLKHGFITVQGPSSLTYQIQRKSHIVKVWNNGVLLSTLCVYVDNTYGIPPTDDVVAKMLICQNDEIGIWRRANIGWRRANDNFKNIASKDIKEEHLSELLVAKHHEKDPGGRGFFNITEGQFNIAAVAA